MVVGSFGTGIPLLCDARYFARGTHKTLSQKGNIAHAAQDGQLDELLQKTNSVSLCAPEIHSCRCEFLADFYRMSQTKSVRVWPTDFGQ
jgi:hypothetical protein